MTDCKFGHAKTKIVTQHEQGACCDNKGYYPLQKGHLYKDDSPLDHDGAVYFPLTDPTRPMCGFITCETDAREWDQDCIATICVEAQSLIPSAMNWPEKWGADEIKQVVYNKKCCFTFRPIPDCCPPELPACEVETEEKG